MCIFFYFYSNTDQARKSIKKRVPKVSGQMWTVIVSKVAQRYVKYLTLPIAIVVGTIGYKIEQKLSKPQQIPYLDHSIAEERLKREMISDNDFSKDFNLVEAKKRLVPSSSLDLNTPRRFEK